MSSARTEGFTLLELVVVIAVIAILATLVAPAVLRNVGDAKIGTARTQMEIISLALDTYRLDNDAYPTTGQGLVSLIARPTIEPVPGNWRGPYLRRGVPTDPWGAPYQYESPAPTSAGYLLRSLGRDRQVGGTGEAADLLLDTLLPR